MTQVVKAHCRQAGALQRALFAGLEAKQLAGSGEWIVGSPSRTGVTYRTVGLSCDCDAAILGVDPVRLHRAAYWYAVGALDLAPEPEPRLRPRRSPGSPATGVSSGGTAAGSCCCVRFVPALRQSPSRLTRCGSPPRLSGAMRAANHSMRTLWQTRRNNGCVGSAWKQAGRLPASPFETAVSEAHRQEMVERAALVA